MQCIGEYSPQVYMLKSYNILQLFSTLMDPLLNLDGCIDEYKFIIFWINLITSLFVILNA